VARGYTYEQGWETSPAQRIFIAVPCYDGKPEPQANFSILNGMELLRKEGIAAGYFMEAGNCHVDDARNSLVRSFLMGDYTDLVFVDGDVGFPAENLLRLVRHKADVLAGVYPKKGDDSWPVWPLPGERWLTPEGLLAVEGAPTGFMLITRSALEKLVEAHKDRQFFGQGQTEGTPYTILFERTYEDGHRWSGDYSFCRKWRKLGGKVFVDPEMDFCHVGTFEWSGRLGDHWRREAGEEPVRFVHAMERLKAGDPKPEDFVTLHEAWGNEWAASPEFLIAAYSMAKKAKGPVLETGSGLSTLVMAAAGAKVTAVEHDLGWHQRVTSALERFGLTADVEYSPLQASGWYEFVPTLDEPYALLVCDGPPRQFGDRMVVLKYLPIHTADWLIDDATEAPGRPYECIEASKPFVIARAPRVDLDALADDMAKFEAAAS
jgi:hypothetical protein